MERERLLGLYEFLQSRLSGWQVVLRTNRAVFLWGDIRVTQPCLEAIQAALEAGDDVADLWLERFREIVRFQSRHIVPRDLNEPSSPVFLSRRNDDYLPFAIPKDHMLPAAVQDHPSVASIARADTGRSSRSGKPKQRFSVVRGGRP